MVPLLLLRFFLLRNFLRHLRRVDYARLGILAALFGLVIAAGSIFAAHGFAFVLGLPAMGEVVVGNLIELLFFILFNLLVISNLIIGYTFLFRTRRAHLAFSLPLPASQVFHVRAAEAVFQSSWASFVLVGAVLASYGASARASAPYFLAIPILLIAFLLLCGAIGLAAACLLGALRVRFGKRIFAIGGAILLVAGIAYLTSQLGALSFRAGEELVFFSRLTAQLGAMSSPFWPGKWAADATSAFAHGLWAEGLFAVGLLGTAALAAWPLLDLVARHPYIGMWQALSAAGGATRRRGRIPRALGPVLGTIRKDALLFARDPAQSLQLLLFLLLMALYAASLLRFPRGILPNEYARYVALANVAAISFILGSFSSRFVYPLLGTEGKAIWIFAQAPIAPAVILRAKLLFGLAFMVPAAAALAIASQLALGISGVDFALNAAVVVGCAVALSSTAVGFSAAFAEFTSDRPGEVLGTMGGTANFLASSGLVVVIVGLWILGGTFSGSIVGIGGRCGAFLAIASAAAGGYAWARRSFRGREY